MNERRTIRAIEWTNASSVLPHEERDFTVWLSENLELLGSSLGLDELTLVERESRVESYRADIVAAADDGSDDGLPVVIENQYGRTDHGHLGKLITYLAAQQRGLGVWVVEEPTEPHRAAVDFLNRTSDETVGYALVVVRFAPAPNGEHYVDFDVVSEPNLWVKATTAPNRRLAGTPERRAFLDQVAEHAKTGLADAGWTRIAAVTKRHPHIRLSLPSGHPLQPISRTRIRTSSKDVTFRHAILVGSFDRSYEFVDLLREKYDDQLQAKLAVPAEVHWHIEASSARANDQLMFVHPEGGYQGLDPTDAANWVVEVCRTWLRLLNEDPPTTVLDALNS